ncbi:elongation of very long chain fatty acids protein AAEL008004-like [Tribolium madens]|uniref:elongation of very long chain fatty acids protein AAEL008004-like n=1 Tax=Tribolium madens TaxID=41895 RepID=UPI001CF738C4|nr:elongation of very long chain fatty acids protein AAEL008004-like [Tribolium madens]
MAFLLDLIRNVNSYLNKYQDPRTADWLLMSSPFYTLGICISYVVVVKVLGPKLMENRKPFQFKKLLVFYNFLQVVFSIWLFYQIGLGGWLTGEYSIRCQPVDYSNKPSTIRMVHASWWYFFSKFTEFIDTIFFVLRKKYDQVSTLHVIHHGVMPMSVWFGVKFTPGGHSTFFGFLNTFVHIIMYFYYMLSALGPEVQKYLWWKKYLTTLQMIQFVAIMVHAFQLLFTDCNYPRAFVWWIGMHAVMFFFLFKEFYIQTYNKRTSAAAKNGVVQNGTGALQNGVKSNKVSQYYVNGTDLHQRIKSQ